MIGNCQHRLQNWSEAAVFEPLLTTSSCARLALPDLAVLQCQRKPEPFPYGLCLESSCFIKCSSRGFWVRLEKWTRIAGFCLLNDFLHFEVQCSFVVQFKRGCGRNSAWHLRALLCCVNFTAFLPAPKKMARSCGRRPVSIAAICFRKSFGFQAAFRAFLQIMEVIGLLPVEACLKSFVVLYNLFMAWLCWTAMLSCAEPLQFISLLI